MGGRSEEEKSKIRNMGIEMTKGYIKKSLVEKEIASDDR